MPDNILDGLTEAMEIALRRLSRDPWLPVSTKGGIWPTVAAALERRGLARASHDSVGLTDDGRAAAGALAQRERDRVAALDLSPPRRGHLHVVRDDDG